MAQRSAAPRTWCGAANGGLLRVYADGSLCNVASSCLQGRPSVLLLRERDVSSTPSLDVSCRQGVGAPRVPTYGTDGVAFVRCFCQLQPLWLELLPCSDAARCRRQDLSTTRRKSAAKGYKAYEGHALRNFSRRQHSPVVPRAERELPEQRASPPASRLRQRARLLAAQPSQASPVQSQALKRLRTSAARRGQSQRPAPLALDAAKAFHATKSARRDRGGANEKPSTRPTPQR